MKKIKGIVLTCLTLTNIVAFGQTQFAKNTYVAITKPGDNAAAAVYTIYTTSTPENGSSFVPGSVVNVSGANINGIGLNSADMLVYGLGTNGDNNTPYNLADDFSLYRIGADGTSINLGYLPLTGQGADIPLFGGKAELVNMSAGTVTDDGNFVYNTLALTESGVQKVVASAVPGGPALDLDAEDMRFFVVQLDDVAALTASTMPTTPSSYYELDISNPRVKAAIEAFLDDVSANVKDGNFIGGINGGIQDFDINPTDGALYSYVTYPDPHPSGQSVDVVGFPVKIGAISAGKASVVPIGTSDNETPNQEDAGLTFSVDGSKFYGLFTSGQYAEINLSTGAVENITDISSTIPTKTIRNQKHLRGDLARAVPDNLPVKFGPISARNIGNSLEINWITEQEKNNDHFEIYISKDGKKFVKIDDVTSKAADGSSDQSLSYQYTTTLSRAMSIAGISFAMLGLLAFGFKRKHQILSLCVVMSGIAMCAISCSKNDASYNPGNSDKIFVKIVQVDKDGHSDESKTVTVYKAD